MLNFAWLKIWKQAQQKKTRNVRPTIAKHCRAEPPTQPSLPKAAAAAASNSHNKHRPHAMSYRFHGRPVGPRPRPRQLFSPLRRETCPELEQPHGEAASSLHLANAEDPVRHIPPQLVRARVAPRLVEWSVMPTNKTGKGVHATYEPRHSLHVGTIALGISPHCCPATSAR